MKAGDDEMVIGIIREIRQQVLAFLPPKGATADKIRASLDMDLIDQQWVAGTLDFKVSMISIDQRPDGSKMGKSGFE